MADQTITMSLHPHPAPDGTSQRHRYEVYIDQAIRGKANSFRIDNINAPPEAVLILFADCSDGFIRSSMIWNQDLIKRGFEVTASLHPAATAIGVKLLHPNTGSGVDFHSEPGPIVFGIDLSNQIALNMVEGVPQKSGGVGSRFPPEWRR